MLAGIGSTLQEEQLPVLHRSFTWAPRTQGEVGCVGTISTSMQVQAPTLAPEAVPKQFLGDAALLLSDL